MTNTKSMSTDMERREENKKLAKQILGVYAPVNDGWNKFKVNLVEENTYKAY